MTKEKVTLESRLTKTEVTLNNLNEDVAETKRTLKWAIGLIFGLNSTIIGLLTKGYHLL